MDATPETPHPAVAAWVRTAMQSDRPTLSSDAAARLATLPLPQIEAVATAHRIAPWLAAALDAGEGDAPPALEATLQQLAFGATFRTLVQFRELVALLTEFNSRDIHTIVLKGPAIADRYYADPGLRPYGDIDLLVHEHDEAAVIELLLARGFSIHTAEEQGRLHHDHGLFQQIFVRDDGCVVEVHFDHLQIGLRPAEMDEVWTRAVPHEFGGQAALVIEPNDLFVHLCVHLQRHGYERLIWFKDLDLMVRSGDLDWDAVRSRAELEGCTSVVAYTLALLHDMLETPLPTPALALISDRSALARTVQWAVWPRRDILALRPQRKWRLRRLTQFAPEQGARGAIPGVLAWGRRGAKARVLIASLWRRPEARAHGHARPHTHSHDERPHEERRASGE